MGFWMILFIGKWISCGGWKVKRYRQVTREMVILAWTHLLKLSHRDPEQRNKLRWLVCEFVPLRKNAPALCEQHMEKNAQFVGFILRELKTHGLIRELNAFMVRDFKGMFTQIVDGRSNRRSGNGVGIAIIHKTPLLFRRSSRDEKKCWRIVLYNGSLRQKNTAT